MKIHDLESLFVHELKDLHSAETQLIKALPKMAKAAKSNDLRSAFESHLKETEQQVERLEKILSGLDAKAGGQKCKGMEGLIAEGESVIKDAQGDAVIDAALIAAAQRVEHYEVAGYGCARTFAQRLGHNDAADLLEKSLQEEEQADKKLTQVAEKSANERAVAGAM